MWKEREIEREMKTNRIKACLFLLVLRMRSGSRKCGGKTSFISQVQSQRSKNAEALSAFEHTHAHTHTHMYKCEDEMIIIISLYRSRSQ